MKSTVQPSQLQNGSGLSHGRAVWLMVAVTLMWSIAGVVTRHLEQARSFEVTFWRSLFTLVALMVILPAIQGMGAITGLLRSSRVLWASGLCWAVMFTAFMVSLTLTTVANVLVTMAIGPMMTAIFSRIFLGKHLPLRTWLAILAAGAGISWMFGAEAGNGASLLGSLVACAVPLAGAANWTLLQRAGEFGAQGPDMLPAVLLGALISAAVTLPLAWPLQASTHDLGLLALLGCVQLALPCVLVVRLSRHLPAPEIALLGLLEVVFGVSWAWLGAGETPGASTLTGGALVLGALVANEALALLGRHGKRPPGAASAG